MLTLIFEQREVAVVLGESALFVKLNLWKNLSWIIFCKLVLSDNDNGGCWELCSLRGKNDFEYSVHNLSFTLGLPAFWTAEKLATFCLEHHLSYNVVVDHHFCVKPVF